MPEFIIDDDTPVDAPGLAGGVCGLVARPPEFKSVAAAFDVPLIPRAEWPERIRDLEETKSRLSDIVRAAGIPSKDQNDPKYMQTRTPRWGYCWCYAAVGAAEAVRAANNLPYVPLSAFGVAYTIKNGKDEGGWGALALDFLTARGVPSEAVWPNFDTTPGRDNPATWADAALHKVVESWVDLSAPVYDRNLTLDQKMTLLLCRTPVVNDYMWWGHAVYSLDPVDADPRLDLMDPNRWGSRDRNSWGDSYGDRGFFVVKGPRCVPDNAVAPRAVNPSAA